MHGPNLIHRWIVLAALLPVLLSFSARAEDIATPRLTVLFDSFGSDPSLKKDWGYAALIEYAGKRILFDTGDDPAILEHNVKAKGVDLTNLDFVVISHRHSDHMGGLSYVLSVNPTVKIYAPKENFGIFGSSLPSTFYRKNESLPARLRYYDGAPPEVMKFGTAWPSAHFELIDSTAHIAAGITLIALVSDKPGTLELKELSLALETPDGIVLVVGCSHPGIDRIVEAASTVDKRIHLIAGGLHLALAPDNEIARLASVLHDTYHVGWIAPGHCTGEPAFAEFLRVFSDHFIYAGLGSQIDLGQQPRTDGERHGMTPSDVSDYRRLALRADE